MPIQRTIGFLLIACLCGCAWSRAAPEYAPKPQENCQTFVSERLYFGFNIPGSKSSVTEEQWQSFLEQVVTPRFPAGLTVIQAQGQWRGANEKIEKEPSRIVELLHLDEEDSQAKVGEIVLEYKARFRQEAVLVMREPVLACF